MAFGLRLALIAFSIESLIGVLDGRDFDIAIQSALVAGGIFWGLGLVLGELARMVIEEHVTTEFEKTRKASLDEAPTITTTSDK